MCIHQLLQYNTHQLQHRHRPRRRKSVAISISISMQRIFPLVAYLWSTILIYQKCSHDVPKNIMHHPSAQISTVVVDAFSINGIGPIITERNQYPTSSRDISERISILYPELFYKQINYVPCNRKYKSSASCSTLLQSTISDTETISTAVTPIISSTNDSNQLINGIPNGMLDVTTVNGVVNENVNGHSQNDNNIDTISINGDNNTNDKVGKNDTMPEVPIPTANGGYSHTTTSRAKISAANKGKTPWNKGKARSEETRKKIAEGVRRRNRERFLAKLKEEGITEEEYEARKKEERRKKDAERRSRRTAKGGYTPTKETKEKISKILTEKYASGQIKRKPRDPSTIRRGFKHTEETKAKIRASLKEKWANDTEYRELMTNKTVASGQVGKSVRKRISESLKKRWEDPEFRAHMMEKFANRKSQQGDKRDESHRRKISVAMKRKWADEEYRKRATAGMAKGRERDYGQVKEVKPVKRVSQLKSLEPMQPIAPVASRGKKKKTKHLKSSFSTAKKKRSVKKRKASTTKRKTKSSSSDNNIKAVKAISPTASTKSTDISSSDTKPRSTSSGEKSTQEEDGSISRLREERRDLYDLLYGDEDDDVGRRVNGDNIDLQPVLPGNKGIPIGSSSMSTLLGGDDDDLDDFDPYGLQT